MVRARVFIQFVVVLSIGLLQIGFNQSVLGNKTNPPLTTTNSVGGTISLRDKHVTLPEVTSSCERSDKGGYWSIELYNCRIEPKVLEFLIHSFPVDKISLDSCSLTGENLQELKSASHLKSLYIANDKVADRDLLFFSSLIDLEALYLKNIEMSGLALAYLPSPSKLRTLDIPSTHFNDAYLNLLNRFSNLETLCLENCEVSAPAFLRCTTLAHLKALQIGNLLRKGTDDWIEVALRLRCPAGLNAQGELWLLQRSELSDKGLRLLSKGFEQIKVLDISATKVSLDGLRSLSNLPKLRTLRLRNLGLSGEQFDAIPIICQVKSLELTGNPVSCKGLDCIGKLRNLVDLDLSGALPKMCENGIGLLSTLQLLEMLDVSSTDLSNYQLKSLRNFPSLKKLRVSFTSLTAAQLKCVGNCQQLEQLQLRYTKGLARPKDVCNLSRLTKLEEIDLVGSDITDCGLLWLRSNYPRVSIVTSDEGLGTN